MAALWLLPSAVYKGDCQEIRYGVNEGLELVEQDNGAKGKRYVVEDADGNELFTIPLRGCLLDTRFRNGQLRFREQNSKREGFIDRQGMVVFTEDNKNAVPEDNRQHAQMLMNGEAEEGTKNSADYQPEEQASRQANAPKAGKTSHLSQTDLKTMRSRILSTRKPRKSCRANSQKPMPDAAIPSSTTANISAQPIPPRILIS